MKIHSKHTLSIIAAFAAAAISVAGCGGSGSPGQSVYTSPNLPVIDFRTTAKVIANPGNITYSISLLKGGYDAGSDSTDFEYRVVSNPNGGPALGHWMLLMPEEYAPKLKILASSDKNTSVGYSGAEKLFGIKFGSGYKDQETRIVTLKLAGKWAVRDIDIDVKAGAGYVIGRAPGPSLDLGPFLLPLANSFFTISPGISGMINPAGDGWSYAGFVSAKNFAVLADALNYSVSAGSLQYNSGDWFIGNLYNPWDQPSGDDPVVFMLINWGRFVTESGLSGGFPGGYVDGETTFSGGSFTISYGRNLDGGQKKIHISIPPVKIPADFTPRYSGLGNPFLDIQRSVAFYIAEDGSVTEIKNSAHFMQLYGLR